MRVVASVFPVADLVRGVGGIDVEVRTLLGRGASPATFDVTPRTLREVEGARVIFAVGGGLDAWALRLTDVAPDARTVTLLDGIPLEDDGHGEGTGNPHLWLDPVRTRDLLLPRIADALVEAIPHARSRIRQREGALADTLTALDAEIRRDLAGLPHRAFVASHPAWTYFAERYDLVQVGVVHEHPGQEPSPQALARIIRRARELRVPVVFSEPQIPDVGARALGGELGVPVLALDPIGGSGVGGRNSYVALLRYNTRQLVRGLGGPGGGE